MADPLARWRSDEYLCVAIRIRRMVGKLQFVTFSIGIKNKLQQNTLANHISIWRKQKEEKNGKYVLNSNSEVERRICLIIQIKEKWRIFTIINLSTFICFSVRNQLSRVLPKIFMFAHTILKNENTLFINYRYRPKNSTIFEDYVTFKNAPQPDTSDLPRRTYKHSTIMFRAINKILPKDIIIKCRLLIVPINVSVSSMYNTRKNTQKKNIIRSWVCIDLLWNKNIRSGRLSPCVHFDHFKKSKTGGHLKAKRNWIKWSNPCT